MGPRAEEGPLSEYENRLSDIAEAMAKRSFVDDPNEPSWREAREKELEGRAHGHREAGGRLRGHRTHRRGRRPRPDLGQHFGSVRGHPLARRRASGQERSLRGRAGAPILLHVRAEDKYSGGLEKEEVILTWDDGNRSLSRYTNERGWAVFEVPLKEGKTDYTVTATAEGGCSLQRTITIDALEDLDGYGVEWGIEYGS